MPRGFVLQTRLARYRLRHWLFSMQFLDPVKHAVESGRLLLNAKEAVGHGNFTKWIEENFEGTPRDAQRNMRLAKAVDQNRIDPDEVSSLREAYKMLRAQDAEDYDA